MHRVYDLVRRVADKALTVLILGETGVGKECVAEALHAESVRRNGPFVRVNCASLADSLLESELFGHERGAFTGAEKPKIGLFEVAAGGTLFLDEIGDLAPRLQMKLLRVLDRKAIARVGAITETPVDVRVVAATHRDLVSEMRSGHFRQDLFHRLSAFTITVPPLRERPHEILPMAEQFLRSAANELQRAPPAIAADAREALLSYSWPGNVRELKNATNRALVMCGEELTADDLPDTLRDSSRRVRPLAPVGTVRGQLAEMERAVIVAALDAEQQNQTRAARRLGISRRALVYKLGKHGIR